MKQYRIIIQYDGTRYAGWQMQSERISVQQIIESSLTATFSQPIKVVGAGRTDTGVHARGQVASFKAETNLPCEKLLKAVSSRLPEDIALVTLEEMKDGFHALHSATARRYSYHIHTEGDIFRRKYSWYVSYDLDQSLLHKCAGMIKGEHDFSAFSKVGSKTKHQICRIAESVWEIKEKTLVYNVISDRFLRGMVRLLVGTMVDVGRGHRSIPNFEMMLQRKKGSKPGFAAPAHGLFLEEVYYAQDH